jgi:hypothetical protein
MRTFVLVLVASAGLCAVGPRADARPYKFDFHPWLCQKTGGLGAINYGVSIVSAYFAEMDVSCPLSNITLAGDGTNGTTMSYQLTYLGAISNCWVVKDWIGVEWVQIPPDATKSSPNVQWGVPTPVQLPAANSSDPPVKIYLTCHLSAWSSLTGMEVITY